MQEFDGEVDGWLLKKKKKIITNELMTRQLQPTHDFIHRPQGPSLRGKYCYIPNFAKCYSVPISDSTLISSPTLTFLLPFYYYLTSILYSSCDPFSIISLFYSYHIPNSYHMTYSPISVTMLLNPYVSVSRTPYFL